MRDLFLPTLKNVLTKPDEFFEREVTAIQKWAQPILYLFFLTIIGTIFISKQAKTFLKEFTETITSVLGIENQLLGLDPNTMNIAFLFIILVFILFFATSFKYWVSHWYVHLWNKKAPFKKTYAVLTYGGTPGWIALPFSALTLYFLYQAVNNPGPAHWLLTLFSAIIWIGLEGYSIYLRIYALAKIQEITKTQAVLAVYVFGLLTYIIGIFIIEFVLLLLFFIVLALFGALPSVA